MSLWYLPNVFQLSNVDIELRDSGDLFTNEGWLCGCMMVKWWILSDCKLVSQYRFLRSVDESFGFNHHTRSFQRIIPPPPAEPHYTWNRYNVKTLDGAMETELRCKNVDLWRSGSSYNIIYNNSWLPLKWYGQLFYNLAECEPVAVLYWTVACVIKCHKSL